MLISHHICLCKQNYVLSIKSLLFPSSKSLHLLVPEALLFREISSETLIMKRRFFVWGKYVTYKYWQGRMKLCYRNSWQVAGPPHPTLFLLAKLSLSYLSQCTSYDFVKRFLVIVYYVFLKEGGLHYIGGTYILVFIQNGANSAQPLIWVPRTFLWSKNLEKKYFFPSFWAL